MSRLALHLASQMMKMDDLESLPSEIRWSRDVTTRGLVTREGTSHGGVTSRSEARGRLRPLMPTKTPIVTLNRQVSYV